MVKLSPKREIFAQQYVLTGKQSESYMIAFPASVKWKENAVASNASTLLKDTKVLQRIEELRDEVKEKFDISADRLLLESSRIALFDFRRLFDENGKLIQPQDFPDDVAAAVSSVKVSRYQRGDDMEEVVTEVKLWNKNTAQDQLFKHKGLYEKDNKQNGISELASVLRDIQGNGLKL